MTVQLETPQTRQCQDDAVQVRFARRPHRAVLPHPLSQDPRQPGGHIAAHRHDPKAGAHGQQLGGAPRRAGADARGGRQVVQTASAGAARGAQGVARILALGHRGDAQPGHGAGGQILEGVDGQVAVAVDQSLAQGRREDADAAEPRQRRGVHVAPGADLDDLDSQIETEVGRPTGDQVGDESGLGDGQRRAARPESDCPCHGRSL